MSARVWNRHAGPAPAPSIYVGRPSRWGNPWTHLPYGGAPHRAETREAAIAAYRTWLDEQLVRDPTFLEPLRTAAALVCSCAPLPCHADVLVEYLAR
jgi:hypothetical protein